MFCLAVRSPSSMITARKSQKSLFMVLQLNILQSGFKLLAWKFQHLLGVCAEKSFPCLVVELPTAGYSEREVTPKGQQWGFLCNVLLGWW